MQFLMGQVPPDMSIKSPLDLVLQFGMASIVLVVVYFFVVYIKFRDARDERIATINATSQEKVAAAITALTVAVQRLDGHVFHRKPGDFPG